MHFGKNVIKKFHPHPLGFLRFYFTGIIVIIVGSIFALEAIGIGILIFVLGEILRTSETFYILDEGVAREYRLLSTSFRFAEYENLQNLEVNQSFLENIFGIGSVKFDTAGSDLIEVIFTSVKNPYTIEKIVREKMYLK